jgi:DNA/RNA-binding domain of Phe-tRNA-synthetase-like protein
MIKISISDKIKFAIPNVTLGAITANIKYQEKNIDLWYEIENETVRISKLDTEFTKTIPQIQTTRQAYKNLGKEPSRYRPSAEALYRRIIQGKGMYQINNLVDTINLQSLKTGYSIGGFDAEKIIGKVIFDAGDAQTQYQAIGRGEMNIENLPVFYDEIGAFGSPTSDSERTKITSETTKIFLIVLNLGGHQDFETTLKDFEELIKKYCFGENIEIAYF